jgi:hypothetical protein
MTRSQGTSLRTLRLSVLSQPYFFLISQLLMCSRTKA